MPGVARLDAVVMTHAHADHLHGIDDLRAVNRLMKQANSALRRCRRRWPRSSAGSAMSCAPDDAPAAVLSADAGAARDRRPVHCRRRCRSCRSPRTTATARRWAFASAPSAIRPTSPSSTTTAFAALAGIELWIVDCLRREPHPTHSHLAKTLAWIARVKPRRAVLTHMDHTLDYRDARRRIAAGRRARPGRARHRIARSVIRPAPARRPQPRSRASSATPMPSISSASASRRARCSTITRALIADGAVSVIEEADGDDRGADRPDAESRSSAARQHRRAARPPGPGLWPRTDRLCRTARRGGSAFAEMRLYTHETMIENIALYTAARLCRDRPRASRPATTASLWSKRLAGISDQYFP